MRSKLLIAAALMLLISGAAMAAATANVTITVTIQSLGVSVNTPTWAIGTVATGQSILDGSAIVITNTGNLAEDFSLAQTQPAAWTAGTTITGAGANVYVLAARLVASAPTVPNYVTGDVVPVAGAFCNGTLFGGGGYNVAAAGTANMWLLFNTPTSTTDYTQQTVTLTVGCQKH